MDYGELVESKIQEAMAEGRFDNLRGAGRPLLPAYFGDLAGDNWMGFKVLENGGMLPEWLLLGREIEAAQDELRRIDHEHAALVETAASGDSWHVYGAAIGLLRKHYEARARKLKRKQERFNWDAPGPRTQRPPIWVEYHLERLAEARARAGRCEISPVGPAAVD